MNYGRLKSSDPGSSSRSSTLSEASLALTQTPAAHATNHSKKFIFLSLLATVLIIASAFSAVDILVGHRKLGHKGSGIRQPTKAISQTCSKTRYPAVCVNSLIDFPGTTQASEQDLVHISFNVTLQHFDKALYYYSGISNLQMDPRLRSAYEDCVELLNGSVDAITRSLTSVESQSGASTQDVLTWVSAALTNQDTCEEGFSDLSGTLKNQMTAQLKDLSELVSNCLAIYSASASVDFSGVPIQNRRRLMGESGRADLSKGQMRKFPKWLGRRDRRLLDLPLSEIQADMVVSASGNGTHKTIGEAIINAPQFSTRRTIIYVRAGRYEEKNLKVGRKQWNLMLVGDGKGKTVITGKNSVGDGATTFHSASFGTGFIARDITFENYAGPSKHQAVALRVGADHAVVYRCSIVGYQDTCYVHSNRQFFRECDIYGTVDFIFGNAAVVFQSCNLNARRPLPNQKNTITAQNRKDPNQNTGISIHNCRILPTLDLQAVEGTIPTYLGRPWKLYSRTVYILSYMADHIHPRGWLEWNGTFALDTLYYGEYMNSGPGAEVGQRVKWPGYRVITSTAEASKFTVAQFIAGSAWLPSTGVSFIGGLSS